MSKFNQIIKKTLISIFISGIVLSPVFSFASDVLAPKTTASVGVETKLVSPYTSTSVRTEGNPTTTTTPHNVTGGTIITFVGKVTDTNINSNTISGTVFWLYGIAGYTNGTWSLYAPIATSFCTGQNVTVQLTPQTKIINNKGQVITLSEVNIGDIVNATASWSNGKMNGTVLRVRPAGEALSNTPVGFNISQTSTIGTNNYPIPSASGNGTANLAGKVNSTNPTENSFSAEIRWFYGVIVNTSQQFVIPIGAHFCPGTNIPVKINSATKLINFAGQTITLDQVPAGALFNATISWKNGQYIANVLRMTTSVILEKPVTLPKTTERNPFKTVTPSASSLNETETSTPAPKPWWMFWKPRQTTPSLNTSTNASAQTEVAVTVERPWWQFWTR